MSECLWDGCSTQAELDTCKKVLCDDVKQRKGFHRGTTGQEIGSRDKSSSGRQLQHI